MKKRNKFNYKKIFLILLMLTLSVSATTYTVYSMSKTAAITQANDSLSDLYDKLFTNDSYNVIVEDVAKSDYLKSKEMFNSLPEGFDSKFTKIQKTLSSQYENQEKAKSSLESIIETKDGKTYLASSVTKEKIEDVENTINKVSNAKYKQKLMEKLSKYKSEFKSKEEMKKSVDNLSNEETNLEMFTEADKKINEVKDPTFKGELRKEYKKSLEKFNALEKAKEEERIKKEKEEKAIKEAAIEKERIVNNTEGVSKEEQAVSTEKGSSPSSSQSSSAGTTVQSGESAQSVNKETNASGSNQAGSSKNESTSNKAPTTPAAPAAIGPNKIGVAGQYRSYVQVGDADINVVQRSLDNGNIVSALTYFNPNDSQTTWFGGHNPGIMSYITPYMKIGQVITVTDSNGTAYKYKITDMAESSQGGEGMFNTLGFTVGQVHTWGSNEESILIQYCNLSGNLMPFWYGVRI